MPYTPTPGRVLLAYFSRPEENHYYDGRRDLDIGNTSGWPASSPSSPMSTCTDAYDFTNKTVMPVVTDAVSGLGSAPADYALAGPGAPIGNGLAVRGEVVSQQRGQVATWLQDAGLTAR